jgi:hypothetical protein
VEKLAGARQLAPPTFETGSSDTDTARHDVTAFHRQRHAPVQELSAGFVRRSKQGHDAPSGGTSAHGGPRFLLREAGGRLLGGREAEHLNRRAPGAALVCLDKRCADTAYLMRDAMCKIPGIYFFSLIPNFSLILKFIRSLISLNIQFTLHICIIQQNLSANPDFLLCLF